MEQFKKALKYVSPIMIAYFPVSMTFGVLSSKQGIDFLSTMSMSLFFYTGAGQFTYLNMISIGATLFTIISTLFLMNLRMLVMSFTISKQMKDLYTGWKKVLLLSILTDEGYVLSSFSKEKMNKTNWSFHFYISLLIYISWAIGTLVGAVIGDFIPPRLGLALNIVIYIMFITMLLPGIQKQYKYIVVTLGAMIINFVLIHLIGLSAGLAMIIAIVVASLLAIPLKITEESEG